MSELIEQQPNFITRSALTTTVGRGKVETVKVIIRIKKYLWRDFVRDVILGLVKIYHGAVWFYNLVYKTLKIILSAIALALLGFIILFGIAMGLMAIVH